MDDPAPREPKLSSNPASPIANILAARGGERDLFLPANVIGLRTDDKDVAQTLPHDPKNTATSR